VYTGRKHACVQGAQPYTAVFESWTNHVYGLCTAVYTGRKTAVYMVHGHVRAVYTAVFGSWTDHVHGPCMVVYGLHTALVMYPVHGRPLYTGRKDGRVYGRSRRVRTVYTTTQCITGIAKVDSRNLLEGYYSDPIIHSIEIDLFTFSVALTFWVTM